MPQTPQPRTFKILKMTELRNRKEQKSRNCLTAAPSNHGCRVTTSFSVINTQETAARRFHRTTSRRQRLHPAAVLRRRKRNDFARRRRRTGSPAVPNRPAANRQHPGNRNRWNKDSLFNIRDLANLAGARRTGRELRRPNAPKVPATAAAPQHPYSGTSVLSTGARRQPNAVKWQIPTYEIRHSSSGSFDF